MADHDNIIDALAADENRFIAVRPRGGLASGYESINVWNGDVLHTGSDKEEVVNQAREYAAHSQSFDYVVEVHEPKRIDDES